MRCSYRGCDGGHRLNFYNLKTLQFLNAKFLITAQRALRLPPWLTATAVSLTTFKNGITPWLLPFVPLMREPKECTGVQSLPKPPAYFCNNAFSLMAW